MRPLTRLKLFAVVLVTILPAQVALAAVDATPSPAQTKDAADAWKFDAALYLWATGMQGTMGVRGLQADTDIGFGTILDNLEFGSMGSFQATKGRWAVLGDVVFAGLGAGAEVGPKKKSDVDVDLDQWIVETDGAYRVVDWFEVIAGLRYTSLATTVRLDTPNRSFSGSGSEDWVDPLIGGRVTLPIGKRWTFNFRGDVGGLIAASDFTWQTVGRFNVRASEHVSFTFGYRHLDYGYERGSGDDKFTFNVALSGPIAGAIFNF